MKKCLTLLVVFFIVFSTYRSNVFAWSNGGYSSDPFNPDYGTHDWIAQHALDWLPSDEKQYILDNIALYLYGTELPDNGQAIDGIGDTAKHHIYYGSSGLLVDDSAATRASAEYSNTLNLLKSGNYEGAAKSAGIMTHYIADMAVFGHVMGSGTDWGVEQHHSDYENYVNVRTSSNNAEFNLYLSFDGSLDIISAYDAAKDLAYDTTFDVDGNLTCLWMDQNYDWSSLTFKNRVGESLNLAVNYIADVLHTLYVEMGALPISMNDYMIVAEGITFHVTIESNSTISDFVFTQAEKEIRFNIAGPSGTYGFCNVTIPKQLLGGPFTVIFDGQSISEVFSMENDTHTSIYFKYLQSEHKVKIIGATVIPEFPILIFLPLFVVVTLIAFLIRRKLKAS
jgi:hypothetical protein